MSHASTHRSGASARKRLLSMLWPGALAAQAISCAARLGIADYLHEGLDSVEGLARATQTHPSALRRFLRALCSLEILEETDDGRFALTDMGLALRTDDSSGVHPWAMMLGAPFVWRSWGRLLESLQTGEVAFERIFGRPFSELLDLSPEDAEIYNAAMNAGASMSVPALVRTYDFSPFEKVVDVGGGRGGLLRGILEAYESLRGILFDLPEVVAGADQLREPHLAERVQIVGGDLFAGVPAGGDIYVLKGILHSRRDAEAVEILRKVRRAMRPAGRLLIVDVVLEPSNEPNPQKAMMDLMMLTLEPGHERTQDEFADLLGQADFQLSRVIGTNHLNAIVECVPK